jgi:hypothetical protein
MRQDGLVWSGCSLVTQKAGSCEAGAASYDTKTTTSVLGDDDVNVSHRISVTRIHRVSKGWCSSRTDAPQL